MSYVDWLSTLSPLWVCWVAFFVMIYSLANSHRRRHDDLGGPLVATMVAIATLIVGLYIGQFGNAVFGLLAALIAGVGIAFLKQRH